MTYEEIERLDAALSALKNAHDDGGDKTAVRYRQGYYSAMIADVLFGPPVEMGPVEGPRQMMWVIAGGVMTNLAPNFATSLDVAFNYIPRGWFLDQLVEVVKPVDYAGDRHDPTGKFRASVQWRDGGGRLSTFDSATPSLALAGAIIQTKAWVWAT